jgi:hypothetical protein
MDTKSNKPNKELYHQSIPLIVVIIINASIVVTYVLYTNYAETHSITHVIWANILLLIAIVFAKPIIEWRRIEKDNEFITIYKRWFKPITINISESLYQVVMNNDEIRSYRFLVGNNYVQISPQIYVNGQELSNRLKAHIARSKLVIDAVN